MLGSDCQSATHEFNLRQRVISFDPKPQELMYAKRSCTGNLTTAKIADYQGNAKRVNELFFLEFPSI